MENIINEGYDYLNNCKNKYIHMIGIGGSSMSGLAEFLVAKGFKVSGSDINQTPLTTRLESMGVTIYYGHSESNIKDPDLVVYTVAVKMDNPELKQAIKMCIPVIDRATMLGNIMSGYKKSVSVTGTHGKTTTTSMISSILTEAGKDPSVHVGGTLKMYNSNVRVGNSDFFVTEACEYYNSFLKLKPYIGIILNLEPDHLDFFGTVENLHNAFSSFASLVPEDGYLIIPKDNEIVNKVVRNAKCKIVTVGFSRKNTNFAAEDIRYTAEGYGIYSLYHDDKFITEIQLAVPGKHNIFNSLASIATCYYLGCTAEEVKNGIGMFTGTSRRFEVKGSFNGITVVDDYAHHPTEIRSTLDSAANAHYKRVWCIFQPHTYSRTKYLFDSFVTAFSNCHKVIFADIYSASREQDPGDINSSMLADKVNEYSGNALYLGDFDSIVNYIKENAQTGDAVIATGAGNINKICDMLLKSVTKSN